MRSLFVCLLLGSLAAFAEQFPSYPFVNVTGFATKEVVPEEATVTFRIKTYDSQADRSYAMQADVASTVVTFAANLALPVEAIVAQAVEKRAVRKEDEKGNDLEIIGYEATRVVRIKMRSLDRFKELIEFLYRQSNIEDISVEFATKDEEAVMQALTDEACRKAQVSAERLAKGFGRKLGAVRAISETNFSELSGPFANGRGGYAVASAFGHQEKKDFSVIPATIPFRKIVYAIYTLE